MWFITLKIRNNIQSRVNKAALKAVLVKCSTWIRHSLSKLYWPSPLQLTPTPTSYWSWPLQLLYLACSHILYLNWIKHNIHILTYLFESFKHELLAKCCGVKNVISLFQSAILFCLLTCHFFHKVILCLSCLVIASSVINFSRVSWSQQLWFVLTVVYMHIHRHIIGSPSVSIFIVI